MDPIRSEVSPLVVAREQTISRPDPAKPSFAQALSGAVEKVDALQRAADLEATRVARGEGNLHEAALSLEKADVAMRLLVKARNKIVEAYNDVMRMSV